MKKTFQIFGKLFMAVCVSACLLTGCNDDDSLSDDVGDNDPNLVACIGDSITQGYNCEGLPYPDRLAVMCGKNTVNFGLGGMDSYYGVSIISSVLRRKPGYVCILFGSNDAILGHKTDVVEANLRYIIDSCKNNGSIPILGTLPPMNREHKIFNKRSMRISDVIVKIAKDEDVRIADVRKSFGDGDKFLVEDGLHLTNEGGDLLARCFAKKI